MQSQITTTKFQYTNTRVFHRSDSPPIVAQPSVNKQKVFKLLTCNGKEQLFRELISPWKALLRATSKHRPSSDLVCSVDNISQRHVWLRRHVESQCTNKGITSTLYAVIHTTLHETRSNLRFFVTVKYCNI